MHNVATERIIRVTQHEREDVVEELRAAYTLGCLDDCDLDERTSLAYAAKRRGELADLVSDLPPIPPSEIAVAPSPWARLRDWAGRARHFLSWSCGLALAATGAWLIASMARGAAAVLLIFLWLALLRLLGLLFKGRPSGRASSGHQ